MATFWQFPQLPEAKGMDGGTWAVLFLVLVGLLFVGRLIDRAPAIVTAWKAQGAREAETARLERALEALTERLGRAEEAWDKAASLLAADVEEARAIRQHLHRWGNMQAGFQVALLRLAGLKDLADRAEKENAEAR